MKQYITIAVVISIITSCLNQISDEEVQIQSQLSSMKNSSSSQLVSYSSSLLYSYFYPSSSANVNSISSSKLVSSSKILSSSSALIVSSSSGLGVCNVLNATAYNASSTYYIGNCVSYQGAVYQCSNSYCDYVTPSLTSNYWTFKSSISSSSNIASSSSVTSYCYSSSTYQWSNSSLYNIGECVIYGGYAYKCKSSYCSDYYPNSPTYWTQSVLY